MITAYRVVRVLTPAVLWGAVLVAGPMHGTAFGRQIMSFTQTSGPGAGLFSPPVSTRDVDRYGKLLKFSPEQAATAKSMAESLASEFAVISKESREKMDELQGEFEETRDPSVFRDKMPGIMRGLSQKRSELEKTFLADLRLTLTPEQDGSWPRLEQLRRRENNKPGMMGLSGEGLDLIRIAETLGVVQGPDLEGAAEAVRGLLEQYQSELDAALQDKSAALAESGKLRQDGAQPPDPEAMRTAMESVREKSLVVRDVNQKFARQMQGVLAEPLASKWAGEVKKQSFPDVYREAYADKALKSALAMDDLTSEQRSSLETLKEQLDRELSAANDSLAKAVADADTEGSRGGMIGGPGGGPQMIRFGDEPEAVKTARAAKRELEQRMMERLNGALTPSQRGKLPPKRTPRPQQQEDQGGEGEGMEIHVIQSSETRN